jgi:hypothetical protein
MITGSRARGAGADGDDDLAAAVPIRRLAATAGFAVCVVVSCVAARARGTGPLGDDSSVACVGELYVDRGRGFGRGLGLRGDGDSGVLRKEEGECRR